MPRAKKGGTQAPDGRAVAPSAPGAGSQRTDMAKPAGTQKIAAPGGLPYGQRGDLEKAQNPAQGGTPLPDNTQPASRQVPVGGGRGGGGGMLGAPSEFPEEPLTAGVDVGEGPGTSAIGGPASAAEAAAFKVDVLRRIASRPWASPQIRHLLAQAQAELDESLNIGAADPFPFGDL